MQAKVSSAVSLGPLVDHVVIIVKENHTYDNYFGTFPNSGVNNRVVVIAPDGRQKITALNSRSPLSLARALAEELEDNVDRGR